jgi:Periplasmic copper-binding protein (NosD)
MDLQARRWARRVLACTAATAAVAIAAAGTATASSTTLYVSPTGSDAAACSSEHPCRTISHAVSVAPNGAIIIVRHGTYQEGVTVSKKLHLVGSGWPMINATGQTNGVALAGAGAAGSSVRGFVVEHATQEGILAMQTSWVVIRGNVVAHNDLGMFSSSPTGECAPSGQIPGDCGEGIHLMTVTHSSVLGNRITQNAGGVLMTDEFGPTHHNLVGWNRIWQNPYDCGITVPGHSPNALSSTGVLQPSMGGVYRNLIIHNVVNRNGLKGEGAGILIAAGGPGSAAYNNIVAWNTAAGNNLAGITVHSHAPNQDVNGNRFIGNRLSHNNVGGDPDAALNHTADIVVFSAVVPVTGTVIHGNWLANAFFGIWTQNAHANLSGNHYVNVTHKVHQA